MPSTSTRPPAGPTIRRSRIPLAALAGAVAVSLGLGACSGGGAAGGAAGDAGTGSSGSTGSVGTTGDGHGAVAGAAELSEPRLGLTTVDPSGTVTHLDLLDESVTELGTIGAPSALSTDGRYLFAQTDAGIEIVDSGVWTWDHVDHFHYYRAEPRLLGTVEGGFRGTGTGAAPATVATTNLSTSGGTGVFFTGSGEAVLLDTQALAAGEIREHFRLSTRPGAGMIVPVGSFALVTEGAGASASVAGYDTGGEPTGLEEPCVDPAGTITTRVGAVIGCADGALLATVAGDELAIERIPYPTDAAGAPLAPAATAFANREGRPTVAAPAGVRGEAGVWLLDTRERSWTLLPSPAPIVQVTAVDDEAQHVLALGVDGRMLVLSGADGTVLAATEPLAGEGVGPGADGGAGAGAPTLIADQQRAYLSAPADRKLYEIDFADDARVARTFGTATEPAFVAETGR